MIKESGWSGYRGAHARAFATDGKATVIPTDVTGQKLITRSDSLD